MLDAVLCVFLLLHADVAAGHQQVTVLENFVYRWLIHFQISARELISVKALQRIGSALQAVEVSVLLIQLARFLRLLASLLQLK